jgi:hypothetical protein
VLKLTDELKSLHTDLITQLKEANAEFNNPEYTQEGFIPHSTAQTDRKLEPGTKVDSTALTLIDRFPDQNGYKRQVIKILCLK